MRDVESMSSGRFARGWVRFVCALFVAATVGACDGEDGGGAISGFEVEAPLRARAAVGGNGFFVDAAGREVLLRGVNVNSLGEYWQFAASLPTVFPFTDADMEFLASMGLNLVRLVISWSAVEPNPGSYDEAYLSQVAETIDGLQRRGIYTLVDLHQDAWGPTLSARPDEGCAADEIAAGGWDGAPGWATLTDDSTPRCIPAAIGLRELSPAVLEAWAKFWDNRRGPDGIGLQQRYTEMLRHVAARLGGLPGVMGYDIMNEPNAYPGDLVDAFAALLPDLLADEYVDILRGSLDALAAFYGDAVDALRAGESDAEIEARIIVFEPSALWPNVAEGSTVAPFSDDPQLAYGPHIYQSGISFLVALDDSQVERVRAEAAMYGGVPILTGEWGASPASAGELDGYFEKMIALQDREHWSTAHWLYQASCGDPHYFRADPETVDVWGYRDVVCVDPDSNAPGAVRAPLFERISRPALHFAPGPIDAIEWNPASRVFSVSGGAAIAGNEMVLFVPGNHRDLEVAISGLADLAVGEIHGGRRFTARAIGGEWSVRVAAEPIL